MSDVIGALFEQFKPTNDAIEQQLQPLRANLTRLNELVLERDKRAAGLAFGRALTEWHGLASRYVAEFAKVEMMDDDDEGDERDARAWVRAAVLGPDALDEVIDARLKNLRPEILERLYADVIPAMGERILRANERRLIDEHKDWLAGFLNKYNLHMFEVEDACRRRTGAPPYLGHLVMALVRDEIESRRLDNQGIELRISERKPYAHSNDFRSIRWDGDFYTFTASQAVVVKLLWENFEQGTYEVGDRTLLLEVDHESPPSRLDVHFRNNNAWNKVIVPGTTKGSHRLSEPKLKWK